MTLDTIRSRASWGARHDDGDLDLVGLADEVFAHHSVTAQLPADASIAAECEQMRGLEATGEGRFSKGISYNVVIFPSGRAYQGVSWDRRGTHTGGRNSTARSICFAGNYEEHEPTAAQLATAAAIYAEGKGRLWDVGAPLRPHQDVSQTACPGRHLVAQLPAIRAGKTTTPPPEDDVTAEDVWRGFDLEPLAHDGVKLGRMTPGERLNYLTELAITNDRRQRESTILARAAAKRDAGLVAAVAALATSQGLDEKAVLAAVEKAIAKAVPEFELTLTPKEN